MVTTDGGSNTILSTMCKIFVLVIFIRVSFNLSNYIEVCN